MRSCANLHFADSCDAPDRSAAIAPRDAAAPTRAALPSAPQAHPKRRKVARCRRLSRWPGLVWPQNFQQASAHRLPNTSFQKGSSCRMSAACAGSNAEAYGGALLMRGGRAPPRREPAPDPTVLCRAALYACLCFYGVFRLCRNISSKRPSSH